MDAGWVASLFADPAMLRMGHGQSAADANLGLGWVYYALARALRPPTAVVIGSYRGFVPLVLGKAAADNAGGGRVVFVDPSLVDDFWADPTAVAAHFARHGVATVAHYRHTTQGFVGTDAYRALGPVGLLFVDGYHTADQARFDYEAFAPKLAPDAVVLFHDTALVRVSGMYGPGREYRYTHDGYVALLRADRRLQAFDLPVAGGVTLVRRADGGAGPDGWPVGHGGGA